MKKNKNDEMNNRYIFGYFWLLYASIIIISPILFYANPK